MPYSLRRLVVPCFMVAALFVVFGSQPAAAQVGGPDTQTQPFCHGQAYPPGTCCNCESELETCWDESNGPGWYECSWANGCPDIDPTCNPS